MVGAAPS